MFYALAIVFCLCASERKSETRGESRGTLRPTDKKAKQTSLIEYNCVYERGGNALRGAQCERKLLADES